MQDAIEKFSIVAPPIFQCDPVHTVITYFNSSEKGSQAEAEKAKRRAAATLVNELAKTKNLGALKKRTFRDMEGKSGHN